MTKKEIFFVKLHQYLIWKNKKAGDCPELVTEETLWKWIESNFVPVDALVGQKITEERVGR